MASILYRASPIDPALKPASSAPTPDLARFDSPSDISAASPPTGTDIPKPFSSALPDLGSIGKFDYRDNFPDSVSVSTSLPGLAALASVASAPTSNLRYVHVHGNRNGNGNENESPAALNLSRGPAPAFPSPLFSRKPLFSSAGRGPNERREWIG